MVGTHFVEADLAPPSTAHSLRCAKPMFAHHRAWKGHTDMIDLRFPDSNWSDAAVRFTNNYGHGVAWSSEAARWYVLTLFDGETELAWTTNASFVMDMLPVDVRLRGAAEVGRIIHTLRMLLSRAGDPERWVAEPRRRQI